MTSMPQLAGQEFQPARFSERGSAVPFTTPMLSQGRVRLDSRNQLELLVPAFAGGQGVYAIRWRDLPEIFASMTVHDRAMMDAVADVNAFTPGQVRNCAIRVAATGLAGPEAAKAARTQVNEAENEKMLTTFYLVKSAVEQLGATDHQLGLRDMASAEGQQKVKKVVEAVARRLDQPANLVYRHLEEWGSIVGPLGLPDLPQPSRQRRLIGQLQALTKAFEAFAASDPTDARAMAEFAAKIAGFTVDAAGGFAARIDAYAAGIPVGLRNWDKTRIELLAELDRIDWLLDGWGFIQTMWAAAESEERDQKRRLVAEIYRILPLPPAKEFTTSPEANRKEADARAARYLKLLQNWQSSVVDPELVARLEQYKKGGV